MPEINISPVTDIVSGSRHFVPVTRNSCRSSVYDILLKFENKPVIVTVRKRILSVTNEIVLDSDWWPAVLSCTAILFFVRLPNMTNKIADYSQGKPPWLRNQLANKSDGLLFSITFSCFGRADWPKCNTAFVNSAHVCICKLCEMVTHACPWRSYPGKSKQKDVKAMIVTREKL